MRNAISVAAVVILSASCLACGNSSSGDILSPSTLKGAGNGNGKNAPIDPPPSFNVVIGVDNNGDGVINWNDVVTFDVSPSGSNEYVTLNCYQGSSWVYVASGWPSWSYRLANSMWTSGAAACHAELYTMTDGKRGTTLATLDFAVAQ